MMNVNRKYITSTGLLLRTLNEENKSQLQNDKPHYNQQPSQDTINRFPKKPQNYYNSAAPIKNVSSTTINYTSAPPVPVKKTSTVAELPETFGLPSNKLKKPSIGTNIPKYTSSANSLVINNASSSSSATTTTTITPSTSTNSDIQIIHHSTQSTTVNKIGESISAPILSGEQPVTGKKSDNEIEIISENYPSSSSSASLVAITQQNRLNINNSTYNRNNAKNLNLNNTSNLITDEQFKDHLIKNYNMDLTVACKPQCNFVSNIACIDQILQQTSYIDKLNKNQKQYFSKRSQYGRYNSMSDTDDDDSNVRNNENSIKKQKLIVIDDTSNEVTGEENHKPWITPQLINLIKQRNLLQSKLNVPDKEPDPELMTKFKNLRNKVTKLVKSARKEYLAKIIKEKKEKEASEAAQATGDTTSLSTSTVVASKSNEQTTTTTATPTPANAQPTISITSDQSAYMMNLYNTFFNQYMQNYAQQKLPKASSSATTTATTTTSSTSSSSVDNNDYETLKQQAAFYAQQQQSVQKQLETCLVTSTQQIVKETFKYH